MIDLRSDTVTQPTQKMREAMASAPVGDDVYGEDPTVNRLQNIGAGMLGFESALFVSSGTQSNLIALMSHCERGDEYIVGQQAHTYKYEGGGAAVLGSIQPQPLEYEADGTLDLRLVEAAIKTDDFHFARTRLLCLENTQAGKVLPLDYLHEAARFACHKELSLHLDGARVFNAAVDLGTDVQEITRQFDSVSVCLSKGLCAPVGSLICGSRAFIERARRWRKVVGGGMRQAGILAAAGILALTDMVERLEEDHRNAEKLAQGLSEINGLSLWPDSPRTNMVFAKVAPEVSAHLADFLKEKSILITPAAMIRFVTHKDVDESDIEIVTREIKAFFNLNPWVGAGKRV